MTEKLITKYSDINFTSLEDGLKETYKWFVNNFDNINILFFILH